VIKINVFGADPAPQQKLAGLGLDTTSGSASGKTLRKSSASDSSTPLDTLGHPTCEIWIPLEYTKAHSRRMELLRLV
jgi:hypothetical protein